MTIAKLKQLALAIHAAFGKLQKSTIIVACFCIFLSIIPATNASATTFTVTKTADTNDGTCDADCSLREAIVAANADSSATSAAPHLIDFSGNGTYTLTSNATPITEEVIFRGNGQTNTIIDGATVYRTFKTSTDLTIEEMTVQNGESGSSASSDGACVGATGGSLNITNSKFNSCIAANWEASAIHTSSTTAGAKLVINNSTFTNCTNMGAIYSKLPMEVNSSTFSNNTDANIGGAIELATTTATLAVFDSTFTDHTASNQGGAIHTLCTTDPAITINNCDFDNNEGSSGGSIYTKNANDTATITISNSSFTNHDTATGAIYSLLPITISHSVFSNNNGTSAASLYSSKQTTINNCTFQNNNITGTGASGIYCTSTTDPAVTVTNSYFYNNDGANGAGAIYSSGASPSTVKIISSLFEMCDASNSTGAVNSVGGLELYNNTFSQNSGTSGTVYAAGGSCTINNNTFYLNVGGSWKPYSIYTATACNLGNNIFYMDQAASETSGYNNCKVNGGSFTSLGHNLDNDGDGNYCNLTGTGDKVDSVTGAGTGNANLQPLAYNGSVTTKTHAILSGSNAENNGDPNICDDPGIDDLDQRGKYRDATCDIGAYEYLDYVTTNTAPVGGYTSDNAIPAAQITDDASDGTGGKYTITWKGYDAEDTNVVLKSFRYSIDSGSTWNTLGDASEALSADWNTEVQSVSTSFGASTAHTFILNTKHDDIFSLTPTLTNSIISTVKLSFKLYDGKDESAWVNSEVFTVENGSGNTPPVGGYTADDVIPEAQVVQAKDGSGIVTITFKGKDDESDDITLNTFEYSLNGGAWTAPTNADASTSLSTYWEDKDGSSGYNTETDFASASAHSFTFNLEHDDVAALNDVESNNLKIRFTLNDGTADSDNPATSESFNIDTLPPASTITDVAYDYGTDTMTLTGTKFNEIAVSTTDIKSYVNWANFNWEIKGDTNSEITFAETDITSLTVTSNTELTIVFEAAKANAIEATAGFGYAGGIDYMSIAAGFLKDYFGNSAATDAYNSILYMKWPIIDITKISQVISDPINGTTNPKRIPGAIIRYILLVSNTGDGSPSADSINIKETIDANHLDFYATGGVTFKDDDIDSALTLDTVTNSDDNGATYDYSPTQPYDGAVTNFNVSTNGTFAFGNAENPAEFTLEYNVQIR